MQAKRRLPASTKQTNAAVPRACRLEMVPRRPSISTWPGCATAMRRAARLGTDPK